MSDLQVFDCEQGTPEWFACRAGIPTASMFATVMASGRGGGDSKTRRKYMLELIGQRITGRVEEGYTNAHMERGKAQEADARAYYALLTDRLPEPCGFLRRCDAGASPDGLIGTDGGLEIKTKLAHLQIEVLLAGVVPPEHAAQIQGSLWISGRQWWDFVSYCEGLPLFVKRVERDTAAIARIAEAVAEFNAEMQMLLERIEAL
jgi:YqaJ-like viral recombinase domain